MMEYYAERLKICNQCDWFKLGSICTKCGCVIPVKAGIASASCPIKKWEKVLTSEEK